MSPIYGLILAGGASERMGRSKWDLMGEGVARALRSSCERVFVSGRIEQNFDLTELGCEYICDGAHGQGPMRGLLSAQAQHPDVAWLVLACDFLHASAAALAHLVTEREAGKCVVAFAQPGEVANPLCAIWESTTQAELLAASPDPRASLRRFMESHAAQCKVVPPPWPAVLWSANTPSELIFARFSKMI